MLNSISSIFKLILQTHHKYSSLNINLEYQAELTPNYGVKTMVKHFCGKKGYLPAQVVEQSLWCDAIKQNKK